MPEVFYYSHKLFIRGYVVDFSPLKLLRIEGYRVLLAYVFLKLGEYTS